MTPTFPKRCIRCSGWFGADRQAVAAPTPVPKRFSSTVCAGCGPLVLVEADTAFIERKKATPQPLFNEADCGGVYDGVGTVFSDADPGL